MSNLRWKLLLTLAVTVIFGAVGVAAGAQALSSPAKMISVKANLRNILFSPGKGLIKTKAPCRYDKGLKDNPANDPASVPPP